MLKKIEFGILLNKTCQKALKISGMAITFAKYKLESFKALAF
jgi:hypothetical protein